MIAPVLPNRSAIGLDVAHENNRLVGALEARDTERLLAGTLDKDKRLVGITIDAQVTRLDRLINGILDYSSIGSGREAPELLSVQEVVSNLRGELGVRADQLVYRVEITQLYR